MCSEALSLLLPNFCIYHISPPGHEVCAWIIEPYVFTLFLLIWFSGGHLVQLLMGICRILLNFKNYFSGELLQLDMMALHLQ